MIFEAGINVLFFSSEIIFFTVKFHLLLSSAFPEIPQEVSPEDWEELNLSTIELSIATQNRQLDLMVRP